MHRALVAGVFSNVGIVPAGAMHTTPDENGLLLQVSVTVLPGNAGPAAITPQLFTFTDTASRSSHIVSIAILYARAPDAVPVTLAPRFERVIASAHMHHPGRTSAATCLELPMVVLAA
jgi:hypothetical protein